jgi:hypothetical protein
MCAQLSAASWWWLRAADVLSSGATLDLPLPEPKTMRTDLHGAGASQPGTPPLTSKPGVHLAGTLGGSALSLLLRCATLAGAVRAMVSKLSLAAHANGVSAVTSLYTATPRALVRAPLALSALPPCRPEERRSAMHTSRSVPALLALSEAFACDVYVDALAPRRRMAHVWPTESAELVANGAAPLLARATAPGNAVLPPFLLELVSAKPLAAEIESLSSEGRPVE